MRCRLLGVLGMGVALSLCFGASPAQAQHVVSTDSSVITVDVLPLTTEVRLNGALIGTAHELVAQPVFVTPGDHKLEFSAPGHVPSAIWVTGIPDWSTRVWMVLVPDRPR